MNKLYSLTLASLFFLPSLKAQNDTVDIGIVKPLIHFSQPDEGYYAIVFDKFSQSNNMYLGSIIKNYSLDTAYNVKLKIDVDYFETNNLVTSDIFYSDTLPFLAPGQTDTLFVPTLQHPYGKYNAYQFIQYSLLTSNIDTALNNNTYKLPKVHYMNNGMFAFMARSLCETDTLDVFQIPGFKSGDFIGISIPAYRFFSGFSVELKVPYISQTPSNIDVYFEIYNDTNIVYSYLLQKNTSNTYNPFDTLSGKYLFIGPNLNNLSFYGNYFIGYRIFNTDTSIQNPSFLLMSDSGIHHHFKQESIAQINNAWTNLNFIPIMIFYYHLESVEEYSTTNQIRLFPNPAQNTFSFEIPDLPKPICQTQIYLYDVNGIRISRSSEEPNEQIDVSFLSNGFYIVEVIQQHRSYKTKLIIAR